MVCRGRLGSCMERAFYPSVDKRVNQWIIRFIVSSNLPVAMRKLRTALICLLMLALPAQGMAALGMQLCAATGQDEQRSQLMAAHHPAVAMADHHGGQHAAEHASVSVQAGTTADTSLCSLCAFCVGAVALTTLLPSQPPLSGNEPALMRLDRFIGFVAETPERPPRIFLA